MSSKRYPRPYYSNVVQQSLPAPQAFPNPSYQMGYNENYQHFGNQSNTGGNGTSSPRQQPAYGNTAAAANNNNHHHIMNSTSNNGFGRGLNPNAPAFQPANIRYGQQQPQSQQSMNYASPYAAYIQPNRQQFFGQHAPLSQQHYHPSSQPAIYDSNSRTQYLQQIYTAPTHHQQQQQPIQQAHSPLQNPASKYHQHVSMSQNSQPYSMGSSQSMSSQMMSAYGGGGGGQSGDSSGMQQLSQDGDDTYSQFPISAELADAMQKSHNQMAITEIQIGLEQLVSEVHEYDLWANAIKNKVAAGLSNDDAVIVAWLLVEFSYLGTGSQYNFSRLCKLLDSEIKNFTTQFVVPRITQFLSNGSVGQLSPEYLSNFVVFLGELYDKTEVNGVRVSRLGQYLIEQIGVLLKSDHLDDQIVKNIVQVLKLTGRYIEDDQDPACLNSLFEEMEKLQTCQKISSAAKNQIRQLTLLRQREWGITKEDFMNSSMNGSFYQNGQPADGITYGPDGKPLTEEERMFLEASAADVDFNYSSSNAVDDEAIAEYEDFLREQGEKTAIAAAEKALQNLSVDEDDLIPTNPHSKNAQS